MIRANLLPRRRETLSFFSFEFESDLLREVGFALAIVFLVTAFGIGIERYRIDRLANAAAALEAEVAAQAPDRERSRRLMVDVARYQQFERDAREYRRSGPVAAVAIARIGNSLPPGVWVYDITHVDDGYTLSGASHTLESVAEAIASLARESPDARASLVSIDNSEESIKAVKFAARVTAMASRIAATGGGLPHPVSIR